MPKAAAPVSNLHFSDKEPKPARGRAAGKRQLRAHALSLNDVHGRSPGPGLTVDAGLRRVCFLLGRRDCLSLLSYTPAVQRTQEALFDY